MGHIIQNTDKNGNPLYPVTVTDAVVDKEGKTLSAILASGIAGQEEVYIGEEEPTDDNIKVWINPSENGGVPSEGGSPMYIIPDFEELTDDIRELLKEIYRKVANGELDAPIAWHFLGVAYLFASDAGLHQVENYVYLTFIWYDEGFFGFELRITADGDIDVILLEDQSDGGDIAYVWVPIDESELTSEQIEQNKEAYTKIINGAHMVLRFEEPYIGNGYMNVSVFYPSPEEGEISFLASDHSLYITNDEISANSVVFFGGFLSSDGTTEFDVYEEESPDVKKLEVKVNFGGELSDEDKAHNAEVYRKMYNKTGEYILYTTLTIDGAEYESNASVVMPPDDEYPSLDFIVQSAASGSGISNCVVSVYSDGSAEMYFLSGDFFVWELGFPKTFSELYQSMIDSEFNLFDTGLGHNAFVAVEEDICTLDPYYIFSTMTSGEKTEYEARFSLTSQFTGRKYLFEADSEGDVCNYAITHGGILRPTADADSEEARMNKLMFSGKASIDSYVNPCTFRIIANQRKAFTPLSYEPIFGYNKVVVAYKMVVWDGGFFTIQFNNDGTAQMEVIE